MGVTATPPKKIRRRADLLAAHQPLPTLPMLRNSERAAFKKCRFVWDLSYNQHIEPVTAQPALRFGSLVHAALAAYYVPGIKRGENPALAFERLYNEELKEQEKFGWRDEDGKWNEAGELGVAMLENYIEEYGSDDRWEVIVTEHPIQQVVNHPDTGQPWFVYTAVLDGVWRERPTKHLYIPDHKTTDGIGPSLTKYLRQDDQSGSYWTWGVDWLYENGLLKPRQKLHGMLFNFLRKAMPDERPFKVPAPGKRVYLNKDGSPSMKQPSPHFLRIPIMRDEADRLSQRLRALIDYGEIKMFRSGILKLNKSPSKFNCQSCWAADICELHEAGHDWEEMRDATTKPWDPYAAHEVYEGR